MDFRNVKIRNSRENLVDKASGEFNASSKDELKRSILASLGKPVAVDQDASKAVREEVRAAYNDRSTNKFAVIGAAIAGELYTAQERQGFARRILKKVETQVGANIRMDVKFPNTVAVQAVSPSQVQPTFLADKHFWPAEVDISANLLIHKQEINTTVGDIVAEKLREAKEAVMVQEDRLWKKSADALVGLSNPMQLLVGGLTPDSLVAMRTQVESWKLSVDKMLMATDVSNDLFGNNFSTWFDPVTKYEYISTGKLGTLLDMEIISDANREPTLKVLDPGDIYLLSPAEYHGGIADRGPVEATEIDGALSGRNARGWYLVETIAMLVSNSRSFVHGRRM